MEVPADKQKHKTYDEQLITDSKLLWTDSACFQTVRLKWTSTFMWTHSSVDILLIFWLESINDSFHVRFELASP